MTNSALQAAASTDPESWVDDHGDALFAYAMTRLRRREVAEDVVQDALLTALDRVHTFEGRSELRTWLIGILRNKILQHLRREGRSQIASEVVDDQFTKMSKWKRDPEPWGLDPAESALDEELRNMLSTCLKRLPTRAAEALRAGEQAGMNGEHLANLLEIEPAHVYVILYRARTALRKCLEENGYRRANPA